ncbi:Ig-like domain-containing protein [Amylibacter sp.]|nr:Ig-like domain-containing protein [Amylibacter sp.]
MSGTRIAHSPITAAAVGACFPNPFGVQSFTQANPQNNWAGEDYLGFTFSYGGQQYEYALNGASGTAVLSGLITPGGAVAPHITLGALTRQFDGKYRSSIKLTKAAGDGTAFTTSDLTLQNASATLSGSGLSYTAILTPTVANSILSLSVAAGGFTDAAGNANLAADAVTFNTDTIPPTISLGALTRQSNGTYTSAITLSEPVGHPTRFLASDIRILSVNLTLSGSGLNYIATLTPQFEGQKMTLLVAENKFSDAAGNPNTASNVVTAINDITRPTVSLGSLSRNANGTYKSRISLSEVAGNGTTFEAADLSTINATVALIGAGKSYIATLTPLVDGEVKLWLTANAFTDAAGNSNNASNVVSAIFDATKPTVVLSTSHSKVSSGDSFTININFSETVGGFTSSDLSLQNAVTTSLSGSGSAYVATLNATGSGDVVISLPAGVVHDTSQNSNKASNTLKIADTTVAETQKVIRKSLQSRANSLSSNQPDLTSFLSGVGGGAFDAIVTKGLVNFNFSTDPNHPVWVNCKGRVPMKQPARAHMFLGP